MPGLPQGPRQHYLARALWLTLVRMTRLPHRATALGLSICAGLSLAMAAGCSGATPAATSSSPTTASPAPTTTSAAPTTDQLPAPLRDQVSEPVLPPAEFSEAGAEAFLQYVIDAVNWAVATGDTSYLEASCVETSGFCQNAIAGANELHEQGITRHGGAAELSGIRSLELLSEGGGAIAQLELSISASADINRQGSREELSETTVNGTAVLEFGDDEWLLRELGES